MCESSEGSGASEHLLIEYAICTPILCMCESSEGTDKTACMLLLVCALAEEYVIYTPIYVHVREQ